MKFRLCIIGYPQVIDIAKKVAVDFNHSADFTYIFGLMEKAHPLLKNVEEIAEIALAGPSTRRMYAKKLKIPIVSFLPTFPDLIKAIQKAQKIDGRIAITLSRDDKKFDLPLISKIMRVKLYPYYCDNSKEYTNGCVDSKRKGFKVIIGGGYTVEEANKIGLKSVLLYKGMDMIRTAIIKALEICQVSEENRRRISQLNAVVNNFPEGLLLTNEKGNVILDNPPAQSRLNSDNLIGKKVIDLLSSNAANQALDKGEKILNVVENKKLVVNYIPIISDETIHGIICTLKKIDEIQDAEFTVRKRLHNRGFSSKYSMDDIVGKNKTFRQCKEEALLFSKASDPILITGESGTGKELFAHAIHAASDRKKGPFVAINCATLLNELLESELFGYEKGAFTGAHETGKKGLIEIAHKGTLFLDEITTLNYPLQAKLLRLISENEILKLGSDRIIPIDVRILAATNENIESNVEKRSFREDLYYRLNVFRLQIPPLHERPDDIAPLFLNFLLKIDPDIFKHLNSQKTMIKKALIGHTFKGNARELENVAKRFCLIFRSTKKKGALDKIIEACLGKKISTVPSGESQDLLKIAAQCSEK